MKYLQIKKINKVKTEPIYHMTVEKNHNFFANDLCVHNCDYKGPIKIALFNMGSETLVISNGDRIAQGVLSIVPKANIIEVDKLSETERGEGGFGSTGK
jgi:dUTP pyrophosphatase